MRRFVLMTICVLLIALGVSANGINDLSRWNAGAKVSAADVAQFGIDRCFSVERINDTMFARMWKKSYKADCTISRSQLRYLKVLHYDNNGNICIGEMVCNVKIANDLRNIFRELYDSRYPIERMVLIDNYNADDETSMRHNNSSCFNYRRQTASSKLSKHAFGLAVDINTLYNPYCRRTKSGKMVVSPKNGAQYADRNARFPYKIALNDLCYRLFIKHGFTWGGSWRSSKDYQHFEK